MVNSISTITPLENTSHLIVDKAASETPPISYLLSLPEEERRKLDDLQRSGILALMFPSISANTFINVAKNFGTNFSIQALVVASLSAKELMRAFSVAQQNLISNMLDRWVKSEQQLAELSKESQKKFDISYFEALRKALVQHQERVTEDRREFSALPILTILSACTVDSSLITASSSNSGIITGLSAFSQEPSALVNQLSALAYGCLTTSIALAAPVAMSLKSGTQRTLGKDAATAYAITLATLLTNSEIDRLLLAQINGAHTDPKKAQTLLTTFKAALLINATGTLYQSEYGGITPEELTRLIKGTMEAPENNFLSTLTKLVQEQLRQLDPTEADKLISECTKNFSSSSHQENPLRPLVQFLSLWDPTLQAPAIPA